MAGSFSVCDDVVMNDMDEFRPRSGYVYAGVIWFLLGGLLWTESELSGPSASSVLLTLAVGYVSYLLFIRPRVRVYPAGIEIRNPISEHRIGWQDVEAIDSKYTMSVRVNGSPIHAWAAPAQGRYHTRNVHPADARHLRVPNGTFIPSGDSPRSHSGVATHLARQHYERFGSRTARIETTHRRHLLHAFAPALLLILGLVL